MKKNVISLIIVSAFLTASCNKTMPEMKNSPNVSSTDNEDAYLDSIRKNVKKKLGETTKMMENYDKKYVFVVLVVSEKTGVSYDNDGVPHPFQPEEKISMTEIVEFQNQLTDEDKLKIEDQVINNYMKSASAMVNKGRIINKELFIFNSYAEASKKRNSYLIN